MTDLVVKIGGGILRYPERIEEVLVVVSAAARSCQLVVVPGGGLFADAVRTVDAQLGLDADTAHWMAVLAMDQYAHLLASRMQGGAIATEPSGIAAALAAGRVPVLAPSRWLRAADPLPHSWDVTSDSIAAWVAGELGARRLVLVKPPGAGRAPDEDLVDRFFASAVPAGVSCVAVDASQINGLKSALRCSASSASERDRP